MTMKNPNPAGTKKSVLVARRRFAVLWSTGCQERRSAPMTEEEAGRFLERLRTEKAGSPRIEAHEDPGLRFHRPA